MKSLYIKNYKNLKELSLHSLAPVNLIVGRNNVGKSTLLEAISIYLTNGSDEKVVRQLKIALTNPAVYQRIGVVVDADNDIVTFTKSGCRASENIYRLAK